MLLSKYPLLLFPTIHKIEKFLSCGVSTYDILPKGIFTHTVEYPIEWNIRSYWWNIHHTLPLLFIRSHPEDKLALGTLGVDDIVVHLLGLFHGILFVDDRVHPA